MSERLIRVEIDELVLHGFDPNDRRRLADALQSELATVFAARPPRTARAADRVDGGSLEVPAGTPTAAVGRALARQVHGSVA